MRFCGREELSKKKKLGGWQGYLIFQGGKKEVIVAIVIIVIQSKLSIAPKKRHLWLLMRGVCHALGGGRELAAFAP
jgi:hypothetical protein